MMGDEQTECWIETVINKIRARNSEVRAVSQDEHPFVSARRMKLVAPVLLGDLEKFDSFHLVVHSNLTAFRLD